MINEVLYSSNSDDWSTPKDIYNYFMEELKCFDPCPLFCKENNLLTDWRENNFVNPPYSKIKSFVEKAIEEYKKGKNIYLLIPSRTDTKYFHKLLEYKPVLYFIKGRLHFNNSKNSAPFPSVIVWLDHKNKNETIYKVWGKNE